MNYFFISQPRVKPLFITTFICKDKRSGADYHSILYYLFILLFFYKDLTHLFIKHCFFFLFKIRTWLYLPRQCMDVVACICNPAKRRLSGRTVRVRIASGERLLSRWVPIFKRACNPI